MKLEVRVQVSSYFKKIFQVFSSSTRKVFETSSIFVPSNFEFVALTSPWYALTILHFLHKNESAKIWVLIKCDYWSFVCCNTRCQAFNKNNNNLPIRFSLQLGVNIFLLFCIFLGLFPKFFRTPQFSRNVFLHKNESAKVWIILANCN